MRFQSGRWFLWLGVLGCGGILVTLANRLPGRPRTVSQAIIESYLPVLDAGSVSRTEQTSYALLRDQHAHAERYLIARITPLAIQGADSACYLTGQSGLPVTDLQTRDREGIQMPFQALIRVGGQLSLTNPDVFKAEEATGRLVDASIGYPRCREELANHALRLLSRGAGTCRSTEQRACALQLRGAQWDSGAAARASPASRSERSLRRMVFQDPQCLRMSDGASE